MNSLTSRPRSPTRQMTLMSAEVDRAIMPSSDDLPTPEPAKMPRRWPRPHGTSESSARTPSVTRSVMRGRSSGEGGEPTIGRCASASIEGPPSIGLPRPSSTRPSSSEPMATRDLAAGRRDDVAGPDAVHLAERHQQRAARAEADDLGADRRPAAGGGVAAGADLADLAHLGLQAGRLDDQPDQVHDAAVATMQVGARDRAAEVGDPLEHRRFRRDDRAALLQDQLSHCAARPRALSRARASLVASVASTSPSTVRTTAPPRATRRSACTSQCSMPPSSAISASEAPRTRSRSSGLTRIVTRSRSTSRRSAPRTTSTTASGRTSTAAPSACSAMRSPSSTAAASTALDTRSRSAADCRRPRPQAPATPVGHLRLGLDQTGLEARLVAGLARGTRLGLQVDRGLGRGRRRVGAQARRRPPGWEARRPPSDDVVLGGFAVLAATADA